MIYLHVIELVFTWYFAKIWD